MASRHVFFALLSQAVLAVLASSPILGGEKTPDQWDKTSAAQYLDGRGENWFRFGSANRGEGASRTSLRQLP